MLASQELRMFTPLAWSWSWLWPGRHAFDGLYALHCVDFEGALTTAIMVVPVRCTHLCMASERACRKTLVRKGLSLYARGPRDASAPAAVSVLRRAFPVIEQAS